MTTPQFISHFVQTMNDRLESTNAERALEGSRPYCAQLSDEQNNQIEELFVINPTGKANQIVYRQLDQITVGQFVEAASENLNCYPTSWFSSRSTIGSMLFNSKAYVMDVMLVRRSLEDLAGRTISDDETLATIASH